MGRCMSLTPFRWFGIANFTKPRGCTPKIWPTKTISTIIVSTAEPPGNAQTHRVSPRMAKILLQEAPHPIHDGLLVAATAPT